MPSPWGIFGGGTAGDTVKVSASDTSPNFLFPKLTEGDNIDLSIVNPGGNESVKIDVIPGDNGGISITSITPFTSASATSAVVVNIPLADDSAYVISVICWARDTSVVSATAKYFLKKSSTNWRRASGGGAVQVGGDDGPTGTDQITVTGLTVIANSNGVDLKYGGSGSVHTQGEMIVSVVSAGLTAAA